MVAVPLQVCWLCEATKGTTDVETSYSNIADTAPWRQTIRTSDPWSSEAKPTLSDTLGFSVDQLGVDILHIFHLGVGRDLCGSAIKLLASKRGYWNGRTQEARLRFATKRLKWWASQNHYSLSMSKLSKANISWKSDCFPELKAKGFDTFVTLRWLVWEVQFKDPGNDVLATVAIVGFDHIFVVAQVKFLDN